MSSMLFYLFNGLNFVQNCSQLVCKASLHSISNYERAAVTKMTMNVNYFELPPNMDRVCRICLSEGTNLSPIFCTEQDVADFSGLAQKIQICGAIEMHERDGLPSLICDVCVYKASVAHEFRQQCQNSDARLRLYYDKPARSNCTNSTTQTDSQARIIVTKKIDNSQTNYFIKEEMQGLSQELSNSIEVYTQSDEADVTETNHIETDEKLFLCNIGFDGAKELEKGAVILNTHQHPEENLTNDVSQVTIVTTMEGEERLEHNHQVISTITEIKSNDPTNEFIQAHILNTSMSGVDEDEDDVIANEEAVETTEVCQEDEDEIEMETTEQSITHHESEQLENVDVKWNNEIISQNEILPKRLTRNAKSVARKSSYEIAEMDEDSQDDDEEPKFKCKICSRRYTTQKGLKSHSQVHDKQHKCPICLKLFYKLENMEKHSKIHVSKPHACQICHTSFAKLQSLTRHLKIHSEKSTHDEIKFMNDDNKNSVSKRDKSENVNTDDDDDDDRACPQTNEIDEFESTPDLYKCNVCNQFCSTLKNLKRHSLVHGDKKYSCTVCKKWFFRPDTLKKHAEKHGHGLLDNLVDENKLYESDDESFNRTGNTSALTTNENVKRDDSDDDGASGEYKCQHCDKVMATKKGLRRHVSMHKPKAEPATCEICKKVCASQARLVLHQKTHNKPKEKVPREYLCHICSKVYPSNSSLTYHMRTHTGVKPHVCKTCNSGFTTTTSLANHIRIHTGDKPFVCHVCSAAFAVSSAFRRHLTRHTGEANYLCKTCGKAFKRLSTLKEHTYTHSGEKPYVCKTCGAAYSHSGSLFAHQKRCRAQYGEMVTDEHHVAHHIHVNNVQSAVRSLAVIGQMF